MQQRGEPKITLSQRATLKRWGRRTIQILRELFGKPVSAVGTGIVLVFIFLAFFAPWIAPYQVNAQSVQEARQAPSARHPFGTDQLGRDVFSRVLLGAKEVLSLAGGGTFLAVVTGTVIGLFSGYRGGWLDEIIMRFSDSLLALPALLFALLWLGIRESSETGVRLVLWIVYTPVVARVVRSAVLSIKTQSYIESAQMEGESLPMILFGEILPGVIPTLSVEAALRFSYAIFLVASLGYLGVGVQPPSPNWGLMVKEARLDVSQVPWALAYPAAAISTVVIGVNLVADALKRAL